MPTTTADTNVTIPALDALRRPIRDYTPQDPAGAAFKAGMLNLADDLEELWTAEGDETGEPLAGEPLESDVLAVALYAFPGLIAPGPPAGDLVDLALGGHLVDAETADTLHALGTIRRRLQAFEPPGFAAALWLRALLAIFGLIEVLVVLGDERSIERCYHLLDDVEAMADKFAGVGADARDTFGKIRSEPGRAAA